MDYEVFTVVSGYFIIHIINDTKSQTHCPGIEPRFRCNKLSNNHLGHGNAQKFGGIN